MPMRVRLLEEEKNDVSSSGSGAAPDSQTTNTGGTPADTASPQGTPPAGESSESTKTVEPQQPKSAFEAVKAVMDKGRAAGDASATAADAATKTDGTTAAAKADEQDHANVAAGEKDWLSREEYGKLPPRVKVRLVNLTKQKNDAVESVKTFEPKARAYDDLAAYCKTSGLSQDDFTFGLEVMRLIRTDPAKAFEALQPVIRDLQGYVGEILPVDLQKEVDDGTLSAVRAKELALARRERTRLERGSEQRSEDDQRRDAERAYNEKVQTVQTALATWEGTWKSTDPDYEKLRERVWERMVVLMGNKPNDLTPEKAVELGKKALEDVKGWMRGILPPKKETLKVPSGSTNTSTVTKPTSSLEAARMAAAAK